LAKDLVDMSFAELVEHGIHITLDDIVEGTPLRRRIYNIMNIAARWSYLKQEREKSLEKKNPDLDIRVPVTESVRQRQRAYSQQLDAKASQPRSLLNGKKRVGRGKTGER